jgi:hypothetical protein
MPISQLAWTSTSPPSELLPQAASRVGVDEESSAGSRPRSTPGEHGQDPAG